MEVFVWAEVTAAKLLWPPYGAKGNLSSSGVAEYHEAGNEIIALAEQIKAERSVAAMQKGVESGSGDISRQEAP